MKKSTLRRLNATTTTEATAANLNRIMGKRDARQIANMDTETETAYLAKYRKAAAAEFKAQFEAATWLDIDTKAARAAIKALSLDDIEAAKAAKAEAKAIDRAAEAAERETESDRSCGTSTKRERSRMVVPLKVREVDLCG